MNRVEFLQRLAQLAGEGSGLGWGLHAWAKSKPFTQPDAIWAKCHRADWMLWLAEAAGVEKDRIVLAACDIARLSLDCVPKEDLAPRVAIETTERWALGQAGTADVRRAGAEATKTAELAVKYECALSWDEISKAMDTGVLPTRFPPTWMRIYAIAARAAANVARRAVGDYGRLWEVVREVVETWGQVPKGEPGNRWTEDSLMTHCASLVRARIVWADVHRAMLRS